MYEVLQPATIALFYVCLQYDNLKILKLNPCSCNGFVYRHPYTHTHTPSFTCTIFSLSEKNQPNCFIKNRHRRCTRAYRHLLRTNTDYSLFLLSKELHIANPPFTNHRTSAFLNLVVLSHLSSHANWPRTASTGRASCHTDNDRDASEGCQCSHWVTKRN